jgi:hypothetical protein
MDARSPDDLASPSSRNEVVERLLPQVRKISTQARPEGGAHPVDLLVRPLSVATESTENPVLAGSVDLARAGSDHLSFPVQASSCRPEAKVAHVNHGFEQTSTRAEVTLVVAAPVVIQVDHMSNGRQGSEECPGLESPLSCLVTSDRCTPGSILVQVPDCHSHGDNDNYRRESHTDSHGDNDNYRHESHISGHASGVTSDANAASGVAASPYIPPHLRSQTPPGGSPGKTTPLPSEPLGDRPGKTMP